MKIVTLISDFGLADYYVASLKAACYRTISDCTIVDITHQINPFNISQAAFILKSCIHEFPDRTVHIVAVDTEPFLSIQGDHKIPYILNYKNQYIIVNNNGFIGAFLGSEERCEMYKVEDVLSNPRLLKFTSKNVYVQLASRILNGEKLDSIGAIETSYRTAFSSPPILGENLIIGAISHIDSYGNAVTNISRELFESIGQMNPFALQIGRKDFVFDIIRNAYSDVDIGEKVAVFNELGFIQIAINGGARKGSGGAEQLLGLKVQDQIRVEFLPKGSKEKLSDLLL